MKIALDREEKLTKHNQNSNKNHFQRMQKTKNTISKIKDKEALFETKLATSILRLTDLEI